MIRGPSSAVEAALMLEQAVAALSLLLLCAPSFRVGARLLLAQGVVAAACTLWRAWESVATPLAGWGSAAVLAGLAGALLIGPVRLVRSRRGMAAPPLEAGAVPATYRFAMGVAATGALVLLVPYGPGLDGVSRERLVLVIAATVLGLLLAATGRGAGMRGIGLLAMGNAVALAVSGLAGTPVLAGLGAGGLLLLGFGGPPAMADVRPG